GIGGNLPVGALPPCVNDGREAWTRSTRATLKDLGKQNGYEEFYDNGWMEDFIWWTKTTEQLALVVESELKVNPADIQSDFEKLTVFKCPWKLLIFSSNPGKVLALAEAHLRRLSQHVAGEEYLLIGFTNIGARYFRFTIPNDGFVATVAFEERTDK